MKLISKTIAFFLLSDLLFSCNKKDSTSSTNQVNPTYDFSYTGNLWIGDTITFQSTAPATSTFLWTFGDGSTSTMATPIHSYNSILYNTIAHPIVVPDTVTLIINNDVSHPIKKELQIAPDIQRVAGIRTWKKVHTYGPNNNFTVVGLPDASFALTVISDMKIYAFGDTLYYNQGQSTVNNYTYISAHPEYNPVFLSYTRSTEAMTINVDSSQGALGGKDYTTYTYP